MTTVRTVKDFGKYLEAKKDLLPEHVKNRFNNVLTFYGYVHTDANLIEFFSLIITDPGKIKTFDRISQRWRNPKSFSDTFNSVLHVCNLPPFIEELADQHIIIYNAFSEFIKETRTCLKNGQNTVVKEEVSQAFTVVKHGGIPTQKVDMEQPVLHCLPPDEIEQSEPLEESSQSDGSESMSQQELTHQYQRFKERMFWYVETLKQLYGHKHPIACLMEDDIKQF